MTDDVLQNFFRQQGIEMDSFRTPGSHNQRERGYALANVRTVDEYNRALALNGARLDPPPGNGPVRTLTIYHGRLPSNLRLGQKDWKVFVRFHQPVDEPEALAFLQQWTRCYSLRLFMRTGEVRTFFFAQYLSAQAAEQAIQTLRDPRFSEAIAQVGQAENNGDRQGPVAPPGGMLMCVAPPGMMEPTDPRLYARHNYLHVQQ